MSLTPGPFTFSHDRLRKVWRGGQVVLGRPSHYHQFQHFADNENHGVNAPRSARKFCLKLYSSVQNPDNHLQELDANFGPIDLRPFMQTRLSESVVSLAALDVVNIYLTLC